MNSPTSQALTPTDKKLKKLLKGRFVTVVLTDAEMEWLEYHGKLRIERDVTKEDVR